MRLGKQAHDRHLIGCQDVDTCGRGRARIPKLTRSLIRARWSTIIRCSQSGVEHKQQQKFVNERLHKIELNPSFMPRCVGMTFLMFNLGIKRFQEEERSWYRTAQRQCPRRPFLLWTERYEGRDSHPSRNIIIIIICVPTLQPMASAMCRTCATWPCARKTSAALARANICNWCCGDHRRESSLVKTLRHAATTCD